MYGLPLSVTAMVVTGYMLCGAGAWWPGASWWPRAAAGKSDFGVPAGVAALLVVVVRGASLPGLAAVVVAPSLAWARPGRPSRDMLIKRAAPPGATGRVYGTVYSGPGPGLLPGRPVFGAMLDRGMTSGIFFGSAATLALSVGVCGVGGVGLAAARMARPAAVTAG